MVIYFLHNFFKLDQPSQVLMKTFEFFCFNKLHYYYYYHHHHYYYYLKQSLTVQDCAMVIHFNFKLNRTIMFDGLS